MITPFIPTEHLPTVTTHGIGPGLLQGGRGHGRHQGRGPAAASLTRVAVGGHLAHRPDHVAAEPRHPGDTLPTGHHALARIQEIVPFPITHSLSAGMSFELSATGNN